MEERVEKFVSYIVQYMLYISLNLELLEFNSKITCEIENYNNSNFISFNLQPKSGFWYLNS